MTGKTSRLLSKISGMFSSRKIISIIRNWVLAFMIIALLITLLISFASQRNYAESISDKMLKVAVNDVKQDVLDASDEALLHICSYVAQVVDDIYSYTSDPLQIQIMRQYGIDTGSPELDILEYLAYIDDVQNISLIDRNGIITFSTNPDFVGFDMGTGEQSSEFLCIIRGETDFLVQEYRPISFDSSIGYKFAAIRLSDGGMVQVGIDSEHLRALVDSDIYTAMRNRHIGETGGLAAISEDGTIVSCSYSEAIGRNISEYGLATEHLEELTDIEPFNTSVTGELCECYGTKVEGYYIFGLFPIQELQDSLTKTAIISSLVEIFAFIILYVIVIRLIKDLVIDNIDRVVASLDEITAGNLDIDVDVRTTVEFSSLSDNINETVDALKSYAEAENARFEQDLERAHNIQLSALPSLFPPFPERTDFDIFALMDPAKEIGGDFFDFELMRGNQLGFCVADVSGKGIPAALFMMRAKTLIKSYGLAGMNAAQILDKVNEDLCENNDADMFVTCWLGILNTDTGIIRYANAGHNPPLVRHSGGSFEYLDRKNRGFVLAGMENVKYRQYEVLLSPGDEIFLYTDGVTEAIDHDEVQFGETRLRDNLNEFSSDGCQSKCINLKQAVDGFCGEVPQFDDITMLSLKYNGSGNVFTTEASMSNYNSIMGFIDEQLETLECPIKLMPKISVACDEIIANIINYAYGGATGLMSVKIEKCSSPDGVSICFIDHGIPFNPIEHDDPDISLSVEERPIGGLGLFLVKKTMDKVEYEYSYGNNLKITKYFS